MFIPLTGGLMFNCYWNEVFYDWLVTATAITITSHLGTWHCLDNIAPPNVRLVTFTHQGTNLSNQSTSWETIYNLYTRTSIVTREMSGYFADNYQNYNVWLIIAGCWKVKTHQQRQQSDIVRSLPWGSIQPVELKCKMRRGEKCISGAARGECSAM